VYAERHTKIDAIHSKTYEKAQLCAVEHAVDESRMFARSLPARFARAIRTESWVMIGHPKDLRHDPSFKRPAS
jgi:hypothetical protein